MPRMFCDSEAALAISKADGLRKVRHIDIRACFIQEASRLKEFDVVAGPPLGASRGAGFLLDFCWVFVGFCSFVPWGGAAELLACKFRTAVRRAIVHI